MNSGTKARVIALLVSSAMVVGVAQTAAAEEAPSVSDVSGDVQSTVQAVANVVAAEAPDGTVVQPDASTAIAAADMESLTATKIPMDPSDGVSVGDVDYAVTIDLPVGLQASNANIDDASKTVVYENTGEATDIAVQATADAGVRIMTVLSGPDAARSFDYPVTLPEGTTLQASSDGGAQVVNSDGLAVATFAPAWAKDANGDAVPTHYVISGSTLTQVVEHSEGTAYPVVADPTVTRNCGWVTCTWYISVLKTRSISIELNRTGSTIAGGLTALAACGVIASPTGPGAVVAGAFCGVAAAIGGPLIQKTFNDARLSNDCATLAVGRRYPLGHVDYSNRYCRWS